MYPKAVRTKASLSPSAWSDGNLDAGVHLKEAVRADHLSPHRERLVDPEPIPEPFALLAGRRDDCAARREDASAIEVGVEGPPHGELDVADAATPRAAGFLLQCRDRELDFELPA